jgi:hypothetical protein
VGYTSAVDRDRERPEFLFNDFNGFVQIATPCDIPSECYCAVAKLLYLVDGAIETTTRCQVEASNGRAGLREANSETLADTAAGASNERNFPSRLYKFIVPIVSLSLAGTSSMKILGDAATYYLNPYVLL